MKMLPKKFLSCFPMYSIRLCPLWQLFIQASSFVALPRFSLWSISVRDHDEKPGRRSPVAGWQTGKKWPSSTRSSRASCRGGPLLAGGLHMTHRILKWFVVQDAGGAFEETIDVAAPLREERAVAEIFHVRVERGPDVGEHVLVGMLDAALHARRDAARMLTNDIQTFENALS